MVPIPGSHLLVTLGEAAALVWDASTGERLHILSAPQFGGVMASPGGEILATTHERDGLSIWDVQSGRKLHAFNFTVEDLNIDVDEEQDWLDPIPAWRCAIGLGTALDRWGFGRGLSWRSLPPGAKASLEGSR